MDNQLERAITAYVGVDPSGAETPVWPNDFDDLQQSILRKKMRAAIAAAIGSPDSLYTRYIAALDRATKAEERCRLLESRARPFGWRTKIQFALLLAVLLGLSGCGICQRDPHSGFHVCAGVLP